MPPRQRLVARRSEPPERMKLLHVVGARPNLPKLAPVHRAARAAGWSQLVVHTGQHYDHALSDSFLQELGLGAPEVNLAVGSESHAVQTARIMERIEPVMLAELPDWVVVYGDVNSTMAATIVAAKIPLRVAHVEAGLRSHDWSMPEEINRVVTDRIADLLLTPSRDGDAALLREGVPPDRIEFVGNVMIDTLFHALDRARASGFRERLGVDGDAVIVTLHRPSNVEIPERLTAIAAALREIALEREVIFPVHPRTRLRLDASRVDLGAVRQLTPLGYGEMLDLVRGARVVITDSGGLQEETTALGVPCLTVRANTERPVTIMEGTNRLANEPSELPRLVRESVRPSDRRRPEGWDGHAAERIIDALRRHASPRS